MDCKFINTKTYLYSMGKSLKGSIPFDMIIVAVVMVFIVSFFVILTDDLNTGIMDATSTALNQTVLNETHQTMQLFDTGIPFLFFGFILAMILLAWYLRSTPILSIVLIMTVAIILIMGAVISNSWYEVSRSDALVDTANNYPYTVYINDHLVLFLGVMGFIAIIFLFAKPKGVGI